MSRKKAHKTFGDILRVLNTSKRHQRELYYESFCTNYDDGSMMNHIR